MQLFPTLPDDLGAAEADELRGLRDRFREIGAQLRAGELDLGDLTAEQVKEQLAAAVEASKAVAAELASREEAEQNYQTDISELTAELGVEDETESEGEVAVDEDPGDETEAAEMAAETDEPEEPAPVPVPDPEDEPEAAAEPVVEEEAAVAAAAPAPRRLAIPRGPRRHQVKATAQAGGPAFTASAGVEGFREGKPLSRRELAEAIIAKRERATSTAAGNSENVVVASLDWRDLYPESRKVYNDPSDQAKLEAATDPEALVAAGGWCAPTVPMYDVLQISSAERPVRDALPGFNAVRGGVRYTGGLSIADIIDAITVVTADEDAQGGTFGEKGCQIVECPDIDETLLEAIAKCLQFGNLASRAWPELVEAFNDAAMAAWAREAENELLDAMAAVSTDVARTAQYGATSTIIAGILQAVAGLRSRHRLAEGATFRALLPEWLPELMQNDLANSEFDRFGRSRAGIADLLRDYGVSPVWYKDEAAGSGQIFGAQSPGTLLAFPTEVVGYVYPEGTFTFLDGGRLDLGIVRDSTLNANNNYQLFAESFEGLIFTGVESLEITWTVCPSGTVAAPATAITC